jgi:hypothetical protein
MTAKGFGAWKAAIRLLPKRFDRTKILRRHNKLRTR